MKFSRGLYIIDDLTFAH